MAPAVLRRAPPPFHSPPPPQFHSPPQAPPSARLPHAASPSGHVPLARAPRSVLPDLIGQRGHQAGIHAESRAEEEDPFGHRHSKLYLRRKEIEAELRRTLHIPEQEEEGLGHGRRGSVPCGRPPPVPKPRATRSRLPPIPKLAPERVHGRWGDIDGPAANHPSDGSESTAAEGRNAEGPPRWWQAEREALRSRSEGRLSANVEASPQKETPPRQQPEPMADESPESPRKASHRPHSWRLPRQTPPEVSRATVGKEAVEQQEQPWHEMAKELEEMARQSRKRQEERQKEAHEAERRAAETEAQRVEEEEKHRQRRLAEERARERRLREEKRFEEEQRREIEKMQKETEEARKRRKEQEEWEAEVRRRFKEEARLRAESQEREWQKQDQSEQDMQAEIRRQRELREQQRRVDEQQRRQAAQRRERREQAQRQEARQDGEAVGQQGSPPGMRSGARSASSGKAGSHHARQDVGGRRDASMLPAQSQTVCAELQQARAAAMRQLAALRQLPEQEARQKGFKDLLRAWHPDKNPSNVEVATAVFQLIQAERAEILKH
mmetsp:Transcript_15550/g.42960  ORF Transcript_15550/g.42960 Transcript_15550/m.42960 type:complete len:553 (-) Transcript_15550:36-1694(-)